MGQPASARGKASGDFGSGAATLASIACPSMWATWPKKRPCPRSRAIRVDLLHVVRRADHNVEFAARSSFQYELSFHRRQIIKRRPSLLTPHRFIWN